MVPTCPLSPSPEEPTVPVPSRSPGWSYLMLVSCLKDMAGLPLDPALGPRLCPRPSGLHAALTTALSS